MLQGSLLKFSDAESAARYETSRLRTSAYSPWPAYEVMSQWLGNEDLSFEDIAGYVCRTREEVRMVANKYFPGYRPHELRRQYGRSGYREPHSGRYQLFKWYAYWYGLKVRPGRRIAPGQPSYELAGKTVYVLRITAAFGMKGTDKLWAKTRPNDVAKTIGTHDILAVLVDIKQPNLVWADCYSTWAYEFVQADLKYILICNERCNRPKRFDWHAHRGLEHLGLVKAA